MQNIAESNFGGEKFFKIKLELPKKASWIGKILIKKTEKPKRKIWINREIFLSFQSFRNWAIERKTKTKNCNKPRKIFDFEQNGGIKQRNGKTKIEN